MIGIYLCTKDLDLKIELRHGANGTIDKKAVNHIFSEIDALLSKARIEMLYEASLDTKPQGADAP